MFAPPIYVEYKKFKITMFKNIRVTSIDTIIKLETIVLKVSFSVTF